MNSSHIRPGSEIWRASCLLIAVWLAASSGGVGAQERAPDHATIEIAGRTGDPPCGMVTSEHPLVRYLLEELIAQRLENARLHADLAAAGARRAEIQKGAREKETALAVGIAGSRDEPAWSEAQLTLATAAPAVRLLEEARAAEARARARRQAVAIATNLKELDRQMAIVQSVAEGLEQRLHMAQVELKRRDAENERLTAELDALSTKIHSAPVPAFLSAGPNADPMDSLPERLELPAGLLYANWADVSHTVPHPKPRLRASEVEAWALPSDTSDGGAAAPSGVNVAMEDAAWTQAGLDEVVAKDWEPTTDTIPFSTPGSPYVPDTISTAAPALNPFISRMLALSEGDLRVLDEATARLADGLRATREEAILEQQERVFAVDVHKRAFGRSAAESLPLDPALNINLLTAKSELVDESTGGIRFFPDGSSTGGRIELEFLGDRAAINIRWSTGVVTLER